MKSRCLLLVHAHPDDESIFTGATMAKYAAEGYRLTPEPPAEVPAPVPEEPEAVLEVPPAAPENEPPTFGAADDDTFAADKPKRGTAAKKK